MTDIPVVISDTDDGEALDADARVLVGRAGADDVDGVGFARFKAAVLADARSGLPEFTGMDTEVLKARIQGGRQLTFWQGINEVPDTPGEASGVGRVLTVTGEDDQDYDWRPGPAEWSQMGNTDPIPREKLVNAPSGGLNTEQVQRIASNTVSASMPWKDMQISPNGIAGDAVSLSKSFFLFLEDKRTLKTANRIEVTFAGIRVFLTTMQGTPDQATRDRFGALNSSPGGGQIFEFTLAESARQNILDSLGSSFSSIDVFLTITFSDGTTYRERLGMVADAARFPNPGSGGQGPVGPQGPAGPQGPQGPKGDPGDAAALPAFNGLGRFQNVSTNWVTVHNGPFVDDDLLCYYANSTGSGNSMDTGIARWGDLVAGTVMQPGGASNSAFRRNSAGGVDVRSNSRPIEGAVFKMGTIPSS